MNRVNAGFLCFAAAVLILQLPSVQVKGAEAAKSDSFWNNAIVYFVITDRFLDGNPANNGSYGRPQIDATGSGIGTFHGGDIAGLTRKVKDGYFTDLGINALWITAPYEQIHGFVGGGGEGDFAHYPYHGYYALDYTMMDRSFGTVEEMREFVDAAHQKGIRVIMDIVMNHAGYNTVKDMRDYGFGCWKGTVPPENWKPDEDAGENWHSYHDKFIDYTDGEDLWEKWWGSSWIRAGLAGYSMSGNDDLTRTVDYLPDFITEEKTSQDLAPLLKTKWGKENGGDYSKYILPSEINLRKDIHAAPGDYLVKWLSAWVEEFGIDGFRCDTVKHVDKFRWLELKKASSASLEKWRKANPSKAGASWTEPFWMTGEVWNHGAKRDDYFDFGFDSLINFMFIGTDLLGPASKDSAVLDESYAEYSAALRDNKNFNFLSYISSHDTNLFDRKDLIKGNSNLLLCPGAVQIFYGDESARPEGEECSDLKQGTRSDMNWKSMDVNVLQHVQKLTKFRSANIAVAMGIHKKISSHANGYAFTREYKNNKIAVVTGAKGDTDVNVSSLWKDGTAVANAYDGKTSVVKNGKVIFPAGINGVILIEQQK